MPKSRILILFPTIHLLWQFAQRIQAVNIEINTQHRTLLCDCTAEDLKLLAVYEGVIIETENKQNPHFVSTSK